MRSELAQLQKLVLELFRNDGSNKSYRYNEDIHPFS